MPPSVKCGEFLDTVRSSGVLDDKALDTFLQDNPDLPDDPAKVADLLVQAGLMTRFQTEMLKKKVKLVINGKYKLLDQLGAGGMGAVFLCEHKIMRRRVAIKVLPNSVAKDPSAVERFHREARACAALDHPNICRAHDVDQDGKMHFLVIEYIEGASLQSIIAKEGPMDVKRAADCIRQAALGLQHAHESGLVHRDIKPANILLDKKGNVKILDMGLALFFQDNNDNITKQFDSSSVLGTADYLAPEQGIDSHSVDIRADIYALGLSFFFLLTRQSAYGEGTVTQKLLWHQMKQPKAVRELAPNVPAEVEAIIMKMIAKKPEDRYQTPQELADALKPWAEGTATEGAKPVTGVRPETLAAMPEETAKISPRTNGSKLKKTSDTLPPTTTAKTGRTKVDAPSSTTALRGKTKVDKDDSKDSGRRLGKKTKKKNLMPLIIVAGAAGVFLVIGVGLMIYSMNRDTSAKIKPGTPVVQTPVTPPKPPVTTPTTPAKPPDTPKKETPKPPDTPKKETPKPPDTPKPPMPMPPTPPAVPTASADYFPYKPGQTLNYVQVNYVNEGMGVAVHQKSEFKDNGVIETTTTKAGMVQGGKLLAGKPVAWNLSPPLMKKFNVRLGKVPQSHFRIEGQNAEIGQHLLNTKDIFWEPILKLGAKQGDTWEWTMPNGTTKIKYTLEKFEKKDGKDAIVVKMQMPVQADTERVTYITFAKGVGEIERVSNLQQKDKSTTVMEMKLVPE